MRFKEKPKGTFVYDKYFKCLSCNVAQLSAP